MMQMTKSEMSQKLREGVFVVSFTKKNGEIRDMTCTLNQQYMPEQEQPKEGASPRKENPDVLPVWDVEKDAWRSFRLDSVIEVREMAEQE